MQEGNGTLSGVDASDELNAILGRYPLPAGVPDADMTQADLAAAMNTSVNTVGKWLTVAVTAFDWREVRQFPVVEFGGPGKPYVLRLSHAWAWKQNRDSEDRAMSQRSQDAIQAMQASFLNIDIGEDGAVLDPKMRRELAEADLRHSQAAKQRRQLVRLDEIVDLMEAVFAIIRNGIEGMPDRLERELGLKPGEVELVNRVGDDILNKIAEAIEDAELCERDLADVDFGERMLI